jgi:general secretion pathway protein A
LINVLCDTALVFGYGEQKKAIDVDVIVQVAHEKQKGGIFPVREDKKDNERTVIRDITSAKRES